MQKKQRKKLSRYLVYVLRHSPKDLHLELGQDGFVEIEKLVEKLKDSSKNSPEVNSSLIKTIVEEQTGKKRLEVMGDLIRCCYGHSDEVIEQIEYSPAYPPERLYHGTPKKNIPSIREKGLLPGKRKYVHLTTSAQLAQTVGTRHSSEVVILQIPCEEALKRNISFFNPDSQIWLVPFLPPECLEFPE